MFNVLNEHIYNIHVVLIQYNIHTKSKKNNYNIYKYE